MQKPIQNLLKGNSLFIAIVVTISIAYLSLMKTGPTIEIGLPQTDKIEHAFAYCVLALSWFIFASKKQKKTKKLIFIVFGCIFYGIILEVLQATITLHRTAEFFDMLANTVGVLIGLLIFNRISKKNQVI